MPDATLDSTKHEPSYDAQVRLSKSIESRGDMWHPPPLKKSTVFSAIVGALAIIGGLTGGSSYLGNAQGDAEMKASLEKSIDQAIEKIENKSDAQSQRLERKMDDTAKEQTQKLEAINGEIGTMKLDVARIQSDIEHMKSSK